MKIIAPAVLVALFSAASARFLDTANPALPVSTTYGSTAYSSTLNCGQCIGLGYHYCINKAEGVISNAYAASSAQSCLNPGTNDAKFNNYAWSCSNAFGDRVYAKFVCQINTTPCGNYQNYDLTTTAQQINVNGLQLGQTCFYKLNATCGAPAFYPNDTSKVEIEYVEFRNESLNVSDPIMQGTGTSSSKGSNDENKRNAVPASGMPRRNQYFNSEVGGNNITNQQVTPYSSATNGTMIGRSGRYDEVAGGYKAYGNPTQGASPLGNLADYTQAECTNRHLYLAVTATGADATLTIDVKNVTFYRPSESSGASVLSMTLAAVFGLMSLAFF